MPSGVVSWPVYEGFRLGEKESNMARNAFDTFIPICAGSDARRSIIFDFFDLIAAVAAHGKKNGLTGRKLSRLAGWWAFDHSDEDKGFEGGYKSWNRAADASSHLFFAYLRSLSPEVEPSMNVIERIPRSLQALLASTEYPPESPTSLQRSTPRVVMIVDTVSPTPFALLRRAKHFEYRDRDRVLREYSEFEDPIDALTDECKRVLYAVSTTNQSTSLRSRHGGQSQPQESWTAFQSLGFSDIDENSLIPTSPEKKDYLQSTRTVGQGPRSEPRSRQSDGNRPMTPSWADFLNTGFTDDEASKSTTLLYPPSKTLPPLGSRGSSVSAMDGSNDNLAPGELAAITNVELDDAFWWVWMTSLADEEPSGRKAVFGRCALIETSIMNGRWLVMEEQVKGASPDPVQAEYVTPKKGIFSFTKRSRTTRKRVSSKTPIPQNISEKSLPAVPNKTTVAPEQTAKIRAAAAALNRKQETPDSDTAYRRGRVDESQAAKTNSVLTMGLQSEAGPAMKWASSYDKQAIRAQYLGDAFAGRGMSREELSKRNSSVNLSGSSVAASPGPSPVPPAEATFETGSSTRAVAPSSKHEIYPAAMNIGPSSLVELPVASPTVARTSPFASTPDEATKEVDEHPSVPTQLAQIDTTHTFDHEIVDEPQPSPTSPRLSRKPVPRPESRPTQTNETTLPSAEQDSTATAGLGIASQRPKSPKLVKSPPRSKANQTKTQKPTSSGGFKKLFGKKTDSSTQNESVDNARRPNNSLAPPSESSLGRRISLMRRKPGVPVVSNDSQASIPATVTPPVVQQTAPVEERPVTPEEPVDYHDHGEQGVPTLDMSHTEYDKPQPQELEASQFHQGPVDDMPSAAPADSGSSDVSPQPNEHEFDARPSVDDSAPAPNVPFTAPDRHHRDTVEEEEHEEEIERSPPPFPYSPDVPSVQDRWAAIRENAVRKAAQRVSEEQSVQSRPSQSARTDDGETSGEESKSLLFKS